jgi:hypothetical protein
LKVPTIVAQILSKFSLDFSKPDELQIRLGKEHALADRLINNSLIYIYVLLLSLPHAQETSVCPLLLHLLSFKTFNQAGILLYNFPLPEPALLPFDGRLQLYVLHG